MKYKFTMEKYQLKILGRKSQKSIGHGFKDVSQSWQLVRNIAL